MLDFLAASPLTTYLTKLDRRVSLSQEDREAFLSLPTTVQQIDAPQCIVEEGRSAVRSIFLLDGLISRQVYIDNKPKIVSLSFPGDAVDLQALFFRHTDQALYSHTPATIATVPHTDLIDLCRRAPILAQTLWHDTLVDSAIFREWTINVGHRQAVDRIAYFLLEIEARTNVNGAQDGVFRLPLVQQEIASALGLSLVHLNKSLKRLRDAGWIRMQGKEFQIQNVEALKKKVGFDGKYLHIGESAAFEKSDFALATVK